MTVTRTHRLDIYPAVLHYTTKRKDLYAHLSEVGRREGDADASGFTCSDLEKTTGDLHVLIFLDAKWHKEHHDPETELLRARVHECVHAAGMILDHVGQEYDGSSEALAYLADWIFTWTLKGDPIEPGGM